MRTVDKGILISVAIFTFAYVAFNLVPTGSSTVGVTIPEGGKVHRALIANDLHDDRQIVALYSTDDCVFQGEASSTLEKGEIAPGIEGIPYRRWSIQVYGAQCQGINKKVKMQAIPVEPKLRGVRSGDDFIIFDID